MKRFIFSCTDRLTSGHRPIPERPGVQGEQLLRTEPPAGWGTSSPGLAYCSETLPSSAQDFAGVTLAREESA